MLDTQKSCGLEGFSIFDKAQSGCTLEVNQSNNITTLKTHKYLSLKVISMGLKFPQFEEEDKDGRKKNEV